MSKFPRILPYSNRHNEKTDDTADSDQHYSWIRRLESHIQSLSSRLAAIEKRLSIQTEDHPLPPPLSSQKQTQKMKTDEAAQQQINELQTQIQDLTDQLATLQKKTVKHQTTTQQELSRLYKREPPILQIGNVELPIEISGLLGGILAFILAGLVLLGQAQLITSPAFLILVGFVFLLSTLLKIWNPKQNKTTQESASQSKI